MIVEVGALLHESSFQFGDFQVECHFVRALFGWGPGNEYLWFACFLLRSATAGKAIFSFECIQLAYRLRTGCLLEWRTSMGTSLGQCV